ncbi:MAG: hypothetical protein SFU91_02000 [Chloroherpetonaceae bacterium]|nr:hypothetical protein [Chloroherpetonaceae bacterium]
MNLRKTAVIYLRGIDLDDVLSFTRLRAILKKYVHRNNLLIVFDAEYQYQKNLKEKGIQEAQLSASDSHRLKAAITRDLGKTFAQKLSEELIPALSLTAYHLGIVKTSSNGEVAAIQAELIRKRFFGNTLPIFAAIGDQDVLLNPKNLAKIFSIGLKADYLIFISDRKDWLNQVRELNGKFLDPNQKTLTESESIVMKDNLSNEWFEDIESGFHALKNGVNRAFLTDLSNFEKLLQSQELVLMELIHN